MVVVHPVTMGGCGMETITGQQRSKGHKAKFLWPFQPYFNAKYMSMFIGWNVRKLFFTSNI